ncbi:hypothetical protein HZB74_01650 [Candidatus Saccharibacteria bacterium]|nr:hypothetical protein [Candidatus Saccharibacteria bacterium]
MKSLLKLKYLIVLASIFGVFGFASPASALSDVDDDSVADVVEDSSTPNSGDNNYDGTDDAYQNDVATITNPNDVESPGAFVTLEVEGEACDGDYICPSPWKIDEFKAVDPATLPSQPEGKVFPLGMFSVELSCPSQVIEIDSFSRFGRSNNNCVEYTKVETEEGCDWVETQIPANLKLIFDRVMDTSNWTTLKYDPTSDTYIDYSPYITISNQEIGFLRTVVEWSIFDGGLGDSDGVENGYISDPIGPTVPIAQAEVAQIKPSIEPATTGPALANTGFNTQFVAAFGAILLIAGFALMPRRLTN